MDEYIEKPRINSSQDVVKPNKCSESCGRYAVYYKDPTSGRSSIVGYCRDCYEVLCARSLREETSYSTPRNIESLSGTRLYGQRATSTKQRQRAKG